MIRSILIAMFISVLGYQAVADISYTQKDIDCLAQNIYFEAGNQSITGKHAVAYVTLNRVMHKNYPDTICEVVKQGRHSAWHKQNTGKLVPLRHKCQFSWYCDGKADIIRDNEAYMQSLIAALEVLTYYPNMDPTFGATHYHANYVSPGWSKVLANVTTIEDHIFYK